MTRESPAERIRRLYCEKRRHWARLHQGKDEPVGEAPVPAWDGGTDAWGRTYRPVWPRLAELLEREQLDPDAFLAAQFVDRRQPPTPAQCAGPEALVRYRQYRTEADAGAADPALLLAAQARLLSYRLVLGQARLADGWTAVQLLASILADSSLELSALFRYGIARREGLLDLARRLLPLARQQYRTRRADYDRHWQGFVDDAVREATPEVAAEPPPDEPPDTAYRRPVPA